MHAARLDEPLVVTGYGLITGLGLDADACWDGLSAGATGIGPVTLFPVDPDYPVRDGAEAPPLPEGTPEDMRDRAHAYVKRACGEALARAGVVGGRVPDPERTCLVLGSSLAALASAPAFWEGYIAHGPDAADYARLLSYDVEPRIDDLCRTFDVRGDGLLVSNACAAGASAVALAADALRLGRADAALACGFDALDLHTFAGFGCIKALSPGGVHPFGVERAGMKLGDGYAALLLERASTARAAGRRPLARLLGYGESADAHHLTQPDPEGRGAALAMRRALDLAGLGPEAVDYVNVHATATPSNDGAELRGMKAVFGERLATIPLSASKPAVGHTLGGAGAVEAVITLLALARQALPPTLGLGPLDPVVAEAGGLDLVPEGHPARIRVAMSNSFGFGGCNASLLFGEVVS